MGASLLAMAKSILYKFVDMCTVTKVAEAFVLVTARERRPLGEACPHLTCKLAYKNKNN